MGDLRGQPIAKVMESGIDVYDGAKQEPAGRPWLGIRFTCSGAYVRVYRSADGKRYQARCPRCSRQVTFRVGEGGTGERFFEVRCGG